MTKNYQLRYRGADGNPKYAPLTKEESDEYNSLKGDEDRLSFVKKIEQRNKIVDAFNRW